MFCNCGSRTTKRTKPLGRLTLQSLAAPMVPTMSSLSLMWPRCTRNMSCSTARLVGSRRTAPFNDLIPDCGVLDADCHLHAGNLPHLPTSSHDMIYRVQRARAKTAFLAFAPAKRHNCPGRSFVRWSVGCRSATRRHPGQAVFFDNGGN
mmetsp:Transcript_41322/g.96015  ORF Transcript_41322/g.96015 Transcript_41322/m.96015 type:complete len:149 (+) Transcript_41322:232-678(+)